MQESLIQVKNFHLHYGTNHVLKNINIDFPDKKVTAVIGPSGCGKSTLLKCLNRLVENVDDTSIMGQVLVAGDDIYNPKADITEIRRKMGLLMQRPSPLPMSIYNNVAFGPRLFGENKKVTIDAIVEKNLTEVGLWDEVKDRLKSPASKLSIGQQQRLCLARGLAVEPEIILADEPTSALDPVSTQRIEQKFLELKNDYTIILVTHILRQARRMADYVVFIYYGEIIEHGTAEEFFENPKQEMTRNYLKGLIP